MVGIAEITSMNSKNDSTLNCERILKISLFICIILIQALFALPAKASAPALILKGVEIYNFADTESQYEDAVRCFYEAALMEPHYIPGLVWLGVSYMDSAKFNERKADAINCFEKALIESDGIYADYKATARQRLLRLRGHTKTVALCYDDGNSALNHETGVRILEQTRSPLAEDERFSIVSSDAVGFKSNMLQNELMSNAQRVNVGWVIVVNLSKKIDAIAMTSNIVVSVSFYDCDLRRTISQFEISGEKQSGTSSQDISGRTIANIGKNISKQFIEISDSEDSIVMDVPGTHSVQIGSSGIYADTIETDRKRIKSLPIVVLMTPVSVTGETDQRYNDLACLVAIQETRRKLLSTGKCAVISPQMLNKVGGMSFDKLAPEEVMKRIGARCKIVIMTNITRCMTYDADIVSSKNKGISAEVQLKTTLMIKGQNAPIELQGIANTAPVTEKTESSNSVIVTKETMHGLLVDVATKAAQNSMSLINTAMTPAILVVLEFDAGRTDTNLVAAIGSLQEQMLACFPVDRVLYINLIASTKIGSKNLASRIAKLNTFGSTTYTTGELDITISSKPPNSTPQMKGQVTVKISVNLLGPSCDKIVTKFEETSVQSFDWASIARGSKIETNDAVKDAAKKGAEEAIKLLSKKVLTFISQNEDKF